MSEPLRVESRLFHQYINGDSRSMNLLSMFRFGSFRQREASAAPIRHSHRLERPFDAERPLEFRFPNIGRT